MESIHISKKYSGAMICDSLLEPLRKMIFLLNLEKNEKWFSQTHVFRTPDKQPGKIIVEALTKGQPMMISRLGTSELHILLNFLSREVPLRKRMTNYLTGKYPEFWWGRYAKEDIYQNSGFFSLTNSNLERFAGLYLDCLAQVDVLLTWLKGEQHLSKYFQREIQKAYIYDSEPYFDREEPWTTALTGKKVLVIHPFEQSIIVQYKKRHLLFKDQRVLPEFELKTIKAPLTIRGNVHGYADWFDVLESLKRQINEQDFDIALIGAGAYGLPLAAHVKARGKKGVHLGGFLQFLFGIIGKRWKDSAFHKPFINEYWKTPFSDEHPGGYKQLDHGSYW